MYERPDGIENERIWIDGCFDFTHHGAMLQARQLGKELYVGVHSDAEILHNKGPVVMTLDERMTSVNGCKWSTVAVADAPYVTEPEFMAKYGCKYVVHGDDITTDANGEDCYKDVKERGLFVVVKRTPNILTTDLVGRMLLMNKAHHIAPLGAKSAKEDHPVYAAVDSFRRYASDASGLKPGAGVYIASPWECVVAPGACVQDKLSKGIVYVDGGFDLFHAGHIEALRLAAERAREQGLAVVVGLHEDHVTNLHKGLNYPIMTLVERALCVLQCRYVDALVIGAPYVPTVEYLDSLPGSVKLVVHGPTPVESDVYDTHKFVQLPDHKYLHMNTEFIVDRVLSNKKAYEERQKRKGWKGQVELQLREQELSCAQ